MEAKKASLLASTWDAPKTPLSVDDTQEIPAYSDQVGCGAFRDGNRDRRLKIRPIRPSRLWLPNHVEHARSAR